MKTTPSQVRRALQKKYPSLDIIKTEGSWYVVGDETVSWADRCIYTSNFHGKNADFWVSVIEAKMDDPSEYESEMEETDKDEMDMQDAWGERGIVYAEEV